MPVCSPAINSDLCLPSLLNPLALPHSDKARRCSYSYYCNSQSATPTLQFTLLHNVPNFRNRGRCSRAIHNLWNDTTAVRQFLASLDLCTVCLVILSSYFHQLSCNYNHPAVQTALIVPPYPIVCSLILTWTYLHHSMVASLSIVNLSLSRPEVMEGTWRRLHFSTFYQELLIFLM